MGTRVCPACGSRGGAWVARYRTPTGSERSRSFDRRADADRWLTSQEASKLTGEWVDPALGRMTFGEWVERWEPSTVDLRPTTRALNMGIVRNYLLPRFGSWPLGRIGTSDVRAMVAAENVGELSASAVRRHAIVLGTILEAARTDGRIARNPVRAVKLPPETTRTMRFLEPEQVAALAEALPHHYAPMMLTAAYVGLRWGELAGLATNRVDLLHRTIRVERQLLEVGGHVSFGPPKTRAGSRTVSLPRFLADDVLAEHLTRPPVIASGLAFPGPKGAALRRANFRRVLLKACERAGIGPVRFHELRHTAAALAIAQGAHPLAIRERLGHSSITVTMDTYGGLFPRLEEAIAEGLDGVLRASFAGQPRDDDGNLADLRRSGA